MGPSTRSGKQNGVTCGDVRTAAVASSPIASLHLDTMRMRTTETGQMWIDGEGIVHFVATGAASTADTAADNLAVLEELTAGGKTAILFDVRSWPSGSPAFWVRFINAVEHICLAGAILVDPQSQDNLGTFPSLISSLLVPLQVFLDEDEALAFLRNHLSS